MVEDKVNHPKHYTSHPSGHEIITFTSHMSFCLGNAFKYLARHKDKNGLEDLKKCQWYINYEYDNKVDYQPYITKDIQKKFYEFNIHNEIGEKVIFALLWQVNWMHSTEDYSNKDTLVLLSLTKTLIADLISRHTPTEIRSFYD